MAHSPASVAGIDNGSDGRSQISAFWLRGFLTRTDGTATRSSAKLAQLNCDSVRAAYNAAEYPPERRKMMQSWADYLDELGIEEGGRAGATFDQGQRYGTYLRRCQLG